MKKRIIRRGDEVEIKFSVTLTKEQIDGVDKIKSDPNLSLDNLRTTDPDLFLSLLRIYMLEVHLWDNSQDYKQVILGNIRTRQHREARDEAKRRDKQRVRRNRKKD